LKPAITARFDIDIKNDIHGPRPHDLTTTITNDAEFGEDPTLHTIVYFRPKAAKANFAHDLQLPKGLTQYHEHLP